MKTQKKLLLYGVAFAILAGCLGCQKPNQRLTELVIALCQCHDTTTKTIDDAMTFTLGRNVPTPLRVTLVAGNGGSVSQSSIPFLVKDTAISRAEAMGKALAEIQEQCKRNPQHSCPNGIDASTLADVVDAIHKHGNRTMLIVLGPVSPDSAKVLNPALADVPTWWLDTSGKSGTPDARGLGALSSCGFGIVAANTDSRLFYSGIAEDLRNGNPWDGLSRNIVGSPSNGDSVVLGSLPPTSAPARIDHEEAVPRNPALVRGEGSGVDGSAPKDAVPKGPKPPARSTTISALQKSSDPKPAIIAYNPASGYSGTGQPVQVENGPIATGDGGELLAVERATLETLRSCFRKDEESSPLPEDFVGIFFNDGVGANSLELHVNLPEKQSHTIPGTDCSTTHMTWRRVGPEMEQVLDTRGVSPIDVSKTLVTVSRRLSGSRSNMVYNVRVLARISGREYVRTLHLEAGQSPTIPLAFLVDGSAN